MVPVGCRQHCHVETVIDPLCGGGASLGVDRSTIIDWNDVATILITNTFLEQSGLASLSHGRSSGSNFTTMVLCITTATVAVGTLGGPTVAICYRRPSNAPPITGGGYLF